ncbi:hypothetical protein [Kribbella hippodromi]|uniref:hypothetical protein n=1 Tax=Kribbella hippodromi TaxID=434347 RepID=UPI0031E28600
MTFSVRLITVSEIDFSFWKLSNSTAGTRQLAEEHRVRPREGEPNDRQRSAARLREPFLRR